MKYFTLTPIIPIDIGMIFTLDRDTVDACAHNDMQQIVASKLQLPEHIKDNHEPFFSTRVIVYKQYSINEYESGLTFPMVANIQGTFQPGHEYQFYYELGRYPELKGLNIGA